MLSNQMRFHSSTIHAAILILICLPYCINLGESSIWNASEAFYAETPREMLVTGNYLAPQFNFQPRVQKPPLTYWAILASYKVFGVNEFAVRLPGALAAIGMVLFCYGTARLLFGPRAALTAAIISATTPRAFILARKLPIDILLLFFLSASLFFLIRAVNKRESFSWYALYICLSLGFLTKGPIAVIIPAASFFIWTLWSRRFRISEIHLLPGILIFAAISLPWYVLIFQAHGWTYIAPFFLKDNLGRFIVETMGPSRGLFYYFSVYGTDFFPWSLLALYAAYVLWMGRKKNPPINNLSFGFPIIWCLLIFVMFSLSKNKQEYYIAPIYPAAAVIISGVLEKILFKERLNLPKRKDRNGAGMQSENTSVSIPTRRPVDIAWFYSLFALVFFLMAVTLPYILHSFMPDASLVLHYAPSLVFIVGSFFLIFSIVRRKPLQCFSALAIPLWIIYLMGSVFYVPALESFRPIKSFCQLIEANAHTGDEAGYFRTAVPSMVYYLRRPIFQVSDYRQMERKFRSDKGIFCVLAEQDYEYFANRGLVIHILDRRSRFTVRFGDLLNASYSPGEELLLVSNRSYPETEPDEGLPTS